MKRSVALGAVPASMQSPPALALEPDAAGREARDELDALIDTRKSRRSSQAAERR